MKKEILKTEYLEKLKDIKLSEASRARMTEDLLEYARFHAVRVTEESRSIEQVPQRTSFITNIVNLNKKSMTAAILAIALMVGGGTSYAAEGAVPGDFLYPIKIEVNENVKSAFAVSNEAEARLQARLASERLAEAEALAARGELTAQVASDIGVNLKSHYDEAEERSATAEAGGDYETSARVRASLEGSFRSYIEVLTDLNNRVSGNDGVELITDIRTYADSTASTQARATATIETSVDMQATAEATVAHAETIIGEVESQLAQAKASMTAEAYVRADARLREALSAHAEAKASVRTEAYQEAYASAQTAIRIASEVQAIVTSMLRLDARIDLDTDGIIQSDSTVDLRNESDVGTEMETDTRTESGTRTNTETETDASDTEVEVDVETDTSIDTDVIDAGVETDSSVRSVITP